MFSFFKKKPAADETAAPAAPSEAPEKRSWMDRLRGLAGGDDPGAIPQPSIKPETPEVDPQDIADLDQPSWLDRLRGEPAATPPPAPAPAVPLTPAPPKPKAIAPKPASPPPSAAPSTLAPPMPVAAPAPVWPSLTPPAPMPPIAEPALGPSTLPAMEMPEVAPVVSRQGWMDRLRTGLRKTGSGIAMAFTGAQIDDALYDELEEALLMADTGVKATEFLLKDLKRRVKDARATDPAMVKTLLADAVADLLRPLEKSLAIGQHTPTVMMVVGVNGAGKTTTIGKLTRHLADHGEKVLLAAADTFRAAAREQLAVWAERADLPAGTPGSGQVEIVSQQGGDPAAVSFDAVVAGKARACDVVIADTAGRLPTQLHLMDELKKVRRVIEKAQAGAPHEVLLVVDGNTGQNALMQVKAFDDALKLTGLVITKLDGTAKGGVLAAIARERPVPVYFLGVGEKLEDLETFNAREFAQALLS